MFMTRTETGIAGMLAVGLMAGAACLGGFGGGRTATGQDKDIVTAWGKEVGGLQAGLAIRPGGKRAYRHGETITLVVRVRNVGKRAVTFRYLRQFLDESPPVATDADGKPVPQAGRSVLGLHFPVEVSLDPGQQVELESRMAGGASGFRYELCPANGKRTAKTEEHPLFAGTGRLRLHYGRVIGTSSSGFLDNPDPNPGRLTTGELELEIEPGPPDAPATNHHGKVSPA